MSAAMEPDGLGAPGHRKGEILDDAAGLFSRHGYHATSMRDIGEAAGILAGSLYAHIDSKEDLLYEVVLRAARAFLGRVEALRGQGLPPEEHLRLAMREHIGVIAEHLDHARVFLHEWQALSGRRRGEIRRLRRCYETLWDEIVAALPGSTDGTFARLLVLSAANWTYTWYDPRGTLSPGDVADRFTQLLLEGLGGGANGKIPSEASGGARR